MSLTGCVSAELFIVVLRTNNGVLVIVRMKIFCTVLMLVQYLSYARALHAGLAYVRVDLMYILYICILFLVGIGLFLFCIENRADLNPHVFE